MKFLNHLDLVENEARRLKLYRVAAASYTPSVSSAGNVIFDTGSDAIPKWWDGSQWRDFSYGTSGGVLYDLSVEQNSGSNTNPILRLGDSNSSNDDITITGGSNVTVTRTSGTGLTIAATDTNTTYSEMTASTLGLGKHAYDTQFTGSLVAVHGGGDGFTSGRVYGVIGNASGQLCVHVPWSDTNTNTTYTAGVGLTLNSTTFDANTWGANTSASAAADTTDTDARWYGVMTDSNDKLVVRVPWTDTDTNTNTQNTYDVSIPASTTKLRLSGTISGASNTTDDIEFVGGTNVTVTRTNADTLTISSTDTNTTYSEMTASVFGLGKHAFDTVGTISHGNAFGGGDGFASNRTYGVIGDSNGKLCVHVPWSDTNTQIANTDANYALSVGAVSSNESTLSLVGSSGGSTTTAKFSGTTNEIEITTPATGNGGDITIGLPDDVTITNDLAVGNDVTITGDLTVNGTTTSVNSNTVNIGDNTIVLNSDETGTPSQNAGIEIERGTSSNVDLLWNEGTDKWTVSDASQSYNIIQNVFTTVTGNSGTASVNGVTTALALTGTAGITTTAANQGVTISGGTGITPSKVVTIVASSLNAQSNKLATITHSLGTRDVIVRLYLIDGEGAYEEIYANVEPTTTSAITVQFSANLSANVRCVIVAAANAGTATIAYS